jgi:hypothetical protein
MKINNHAGIEHIMKHLQISQKKLKLKNIPSTSNATCYHHQLPPTPPAKYDIQMLEKQQARKMLRSIPTQSN